MGNIFTRIYLGMLVAMLLLMLSLTVGAYYLNKHRITSYIATTYAGTFKLIADGVSRHHGESQQQWLKAITSLTGLSFQYRNLTQQPLAAAMQKTLLLHKQVVDIASDLRSGKVYILLTDQQHYLAVQLSDFGSSLVRSTAFLILNELGRHPKQQRLTVLKQLRNAFPYAIQLKPLSELHLASASERSVSEGSIAVLLNVSPAGEPTINAYAPFGNSNYVLALGPVLLFDWFPASLVFALASILIITMALAVYLLVHPLEKRLLVVDQQMETLDHDELLKMPKASTHDAIGKLINTVQNMTEKLHRMVNSQNDMVRAISHELRAPVTRIRFRLENDETIQQQRKTVQGIERDLQELENLIDEVLMFSKLQRETPILQVENINLEQLLQQIWQKLAVQNQDVALVVDCQSAYANGDMRYLSRAVENLLQNALKYCRSQIQVKISRQQHCNIISIADDGVGINAEDAELIFEPFKRLDASRNRKTGGYGLGLAIVKQIARWHQGDIRCSISTLGGACFTLSWPQEPSHA